MRVILASQSASRRHMLDAAGVHYEAIPARVDEAGVKAALSDDGRTPRDIADALAELKALKISQSEPNALVIGSDSIVVRADGVIMDKPDTRETARAHLHALSGSTHALISAAVIAEQGRPVWRHVDQARLVVRPLSASFIDAYLEMEWPAIAQCVGCFRIEGPGVTLFDRIDGNHFTILGMPLLPILGYLRLRGAMAS